MDRTMLMNSIGVNPNRTTAHQWALKNVKALQAFNDEPDDQLHYIVRVRRYFPRLYKFTKKALGIELLLKIPTTFIMERGS